MARASTKAVQIAALALLAACQDDVSAVSPTQLERGGDVEPLCLCEQADATWLGAPLADCEDENSDCDPMILVLQKNRGEVAVVDIEGREVRDADVRVPFTTFPHVGDFPSDMAVTPDGRRLLVVHGGDPRLAVLDTSTLLGPTLPEPAFLDLPGPASSIAISGDGATAWVALNTLGAIGILDLGEDPLTAPLVVTLTADAAGEDESESTEALPDEPPDADAGDAGDADDADATGDVPADVPGDDSLAPGLPVAFYPVRLQVLEGGVDADRILVSGFDDEAGGGVLVLNAAALPSGADGAILARILSDHPIDAFAVASVTPDPAHAGAPSGEFLYAADRDEPLLYIADMATGERIDTSGGNPLVDGGGIRLDGLATDIEAIERILEEADRPEDPGVTDLDGIFVAVLATTGSLFFLDVYDTNCWRESGDEAASRCLPHVLRNTYEDEDSFPVWALPPTLVQASGTTTPYDGTACLTGYPCIADPGDSYPEGEDSEPTYGITFYPDVPIEDLPLPDIRRPRTERWTMEWEGAIPWSTGAGGNLSESGDVLVDSGLPFCALGIRAGDVLVVEDGPDPVDDGTDCSAFPEDGGAAYGIVEARLWEVALEPVAQWDATQEGAWLEAGYPLPLEECFPYAVRFHVRGSGEWIVAGSVTGFLHDTAYDAEGRCVDALPPCDSWDGEDCTLLRGRAGWDSVYVNPYIRFEILSNSLSTAWDEDGPDPILEPGLVFGVTAASGFSPLATDVATLPDSMTWLDLGDRLQKIFVSDRAWDGLVEFDPIEFAVTYQFD